MNRKINVLGATYKIEEIKEQDKFMIDNSLCGYCDFYEKKLWHLLVIQQAKKNCMRLNGTN